MENEESAVESLQKIERRWRLMVVRAREGGERRSQGGQMQWETHAHADSPNVLLIIIVLGDDTDAVSDKIHRIESNSELANQSQVGPVVEALQEFLGSRLGQSSQVVHQIVVGHSEASVANGDRTQLFVEGDFDAQLLQVTKGVGSGYRQKAKLVQRIRRVGDQLTEKHFSVLV